MKRALALAALLLTVNATAWADYEVRGRFMYRDRGFSLGGFTGVDPDKPIRFADVEVVDANSQTVLASGSTDATGNVVIQVSETQTRDVEVRVLTTATDAGLPFRVLEEGSGAVYAVATSTYSNHAAATDIDFGGSPIVAVQFQGGDPFNIFDQTLDTMDFIKQYNGAYPNPISQRLTLYWRNGSRNGTYYSPASRAVFLLGMPSDSDGYDDSVIIHEIGHYVESVFGRTDNPGLQHALNGCYPLTLSWSEGFATAFQNMVRDWQGLNRPDIYVDTAGQPGVGQAFISYNVEGPSVGIPGSGNEVFVNAVLWDIVDDAATLDSSPGVDDDAMQAVGATSDVWDVETNYMDQPGVTSVSIEDFWEGWFVRGHASFNGMATVFAAHGMRFAEDAFEPDDGKSEARNGRTTTQATQHSISGDGDADWTRFEGIGGSTYEFWTENLTCGSDTRLDLYDTDGTTLLASNDDEPGNGLASRIMWTATKSGDLFLRVTRPAGVFEYATYDLFVDIQVSVLMSDVQIEGDIDAVDITWRAQQEAGFSHFDVYRGPQSSGPWTRANDTPIDALPGDSNAFRFVDTGIQPTETRFYRIAGVDTSGEETYFGPFEISGRPPTPPAARVTLHAPAPNPFQPNATSQITKVRFDLPSAGRVSLRVYDVSGRFVRTLVPNQDMAAGSGLEQEWDGRDNNGRVVASGVYFVVLDALGIRRTQRAVVVLR